MSSAYTLSVIPLFVLLGEVASNTRLSADLFNAARLLLSGVRGGLAIATIAASACFGAVCGSSIVTAATMTRIALPEMRKAGYDDRLATGSLAAGGSIGILIPPSIILVIYASIAEQSVPKLFAAALLPGLLLTALYMVVAIGIADHLVRTMRRAWREPRRANGSAALAGPWQFILLFVVTIGGIYAGIFSPTEAAAVGAFGSIVLGAIGRRLSWATLWRSIESSIRTSCMLFVIIIGANLFSSFMVQTQFPTMLADGASALNLVGASGDGDDRAGLHRDGMLSRRHRHGADHRPGVPAAGGQVRLRSDLVLDPGGHRRRGRTDSSAGRHEPVRHSGPGARRADNQHLPRHSYRF